MARRRRRQGALKGLLGQPEAALQMGSQSPGVVFPGGRPLLLGLRVLQADSTSLLLGHRGIDVQGFWKRDAALDLSGPATLGRYLDSLHHLVAPAARSRGGGSGLALRLSSLAGGDAGFQGQGLLGPASALHIRAALVDFL
ncbi:MAG: hypothetical protein AB1758_32095 [Candidatus Eremiobacterota bacterium]